MNERDGDFELVTLRNGSRAVRHTGHGEIMHPFIGPWAEAQRLYVEQAHLLELLSADGPPLVIHDVGLGAATNAVAALTCARLLGPLRRRALQVWSFEVDLAPLRLALGDEAGFPFLVPFSDPARTLMRDHAWSEAGLEWRLLEGDVFTHLRPGLPSAEVVFYDMFSPATHPQAWTPDSLARVRACCRDDGEGARLITYSAGTPTRVSLLLAGFFVGVGWSTGGKGETTIAATRVDALEMPLGSRWLQRWKRSSSRAPHGVELTASMEAAVRMHPQWQLVAPAP